MSHADSQSRGLSDMPKVVPPGAKEVALITVIKQEQDFSIKPVMEALKVLETLQDWSQRILSCRRVHTKARL